MRRNAIIAHIALNLSLSCSALGQASFGLGNRNTPLVNAPVFDAKGAPLEGVNYMVELWGGATPDSLTPAIAYFSNRRVMVSFLSGASAGYFRDTYDGRGGTDHPSILAVPPGGWAWLQVRAWDARLGSTYDQVLARGLGGYGESALFYAQGSTPFGIALPAPLIGLQSFSLREVIPEPSSVLLSLLGMSLLFWRRRRPK